MEASRKGIGGPKTPEGKRRVSLNALRSGVYAYSEQAMEVLAEAVGRQFDDLYADMRGYFKPKDPLEEVLVRRISRAAWRALVSEAAENREFVADRGIPHISQHVIHTERFIDIQLHRAIYALERKRSQETNLKNKLSLLPFHEGTR